MLNLAEYYFENLAWEHKVYIDGRDHSLRISDQAEHSAFEDLFRLYYSGLVRTPSRADGL